MSDIYHIPGDNGKDYRLRKFAEYQHEVPSIDCRFLGEWIKKYNLDKDTAVDMIWLLSVSYNEITAIFLNEYKIRTMEEWLENKSKLSFGSARKYVKNLDLFVGLMEEWEQATNGKPYEWILQFVSPDAEKTYNNILNGISSLKNVGHFSAYRFVDCFVYLKDWFNMDITGSSVLDWKNCANMTSGIYNIFYEDERANEFDRTHKVSQIEKAYLKSRLKIIQETIHEIYPEQDNDISIFIGKICSFRNLFKNARYGGFHHDRQLGVIRKYQQDYPEYSELWEKCLELRKETFPERFLGELHDWDGIRKERKKIWLTTGKTGVE